MKVKALSQNIYLYLGAIIAHNNACQRNDLSSRPDDGRKFSPIRGNLCRWDVISN